MAKEVKNQNQKKKGRRLKRSVRKTLGTIFLISAILVAAIPVDGLQASNGFNLDPVGARPSSQKFKVTISKDNTSRATDIGSASTIPTMGGTNGMDGLIPEVKISEKIYTTRMGSDGAIFQFAYLKMGGGDWAAVLLGYNKDNSQLPDGALTIPDTVEAYIQPTGNAGTGQGYVAASRSGEELYYEVLTERTYQTKEQKTDDNGNLVYEEVNGVQVPVMVTVEKTYTAGEMKRCYSMDEAWRNLELTDFYYVKDGSTAQSLGGAQKLKDGTTDQLEAMTYSGYALSGNDSDHQWIKAGAVKYIGNQYLKSEWDATSKTYKYTVDNYIDNNQALNGIFANCSNIVTLNISENIVGVGNYAFNNCSSMKGVSFGSGLKVIGNRAFGGCFQLSNVEFGEATNLRYIGDHAFYSCGALLNVDVPRSVEYIGDYAFAECKTLTNIDMCGYPKGTGQAALKELGWNVFENCEALSSFAFPENYTDIDGTVDITLFKGCNHLRYVVCCGTNLKFKDGDDDKFKFADFKKMLEGEPVNGEFYFEGRDDSDLHTFTQDNCFAFSYIHYQTTPTVEFVKDNLYELTAQMVGTDKTGRVTYKVRGGSGSYDAELETCIIGSAVHELVIPPKIGPYHVASIKPQTFINNCALQLVTIPVTLKSIGDEAFKGCHNLENVIFETDTVNIGKDAFKTQEFKGVHQGCSKTDSSGTSWNGSATTPDNKSLTPLNFIGKISANSTPFKYAMSKDGRYTNDSIQSVKFISYYSGWPTNLKVEYRVFDPTDTEYKGYAELVDFPAYSELTSYASGKDPADPAKTLVYMTEDYKAAAQEALANYPNDCSVDQLAFIDSALNLTIPSGVQAIKDGLFKAKEKKDGSTRKKTVRIYGLENGIEERDFQPENESVDPKNPTPLSGCQSLTGVYIYGDPISIAANAFQNCTDLETLEINGNTKIIGDHAFEGCTALEEATISASVEQMGIAPFKGCTKLENVVFQNNGEPHFSCENSVIYGLENGAKSELVECIGNTLSSYGPEAASGVKTLKEEAFAGTDVSDVDLTTSAITKVPTLAFADTKSLSTVKLPKTCKILDEYAFKGSNIRNLFATDNLSSPHINSMKDLLRGNSAVTIHCPQYTAETVDLPDSEKIESAMYSFAEVNGFKWDDWSVPVYFKVTFHYLVDTADNWTAWETLVEKNCSAVPPTLPEVPGQEFEYWLSDYSNITGNTDVWAKYKDVIPDPDAGKLTVIFRDYDFKELDRDLVVSGQKARKIEKPERAGYVFVGWTGYLERDSGTSVQVDDPITENTIFVATYEPRVEGYLMVTFIDIETDTVYDTRPVLPGGSVTPPADPVKEGYKFLTWSPAPSKLTNIEKDMEVIAIFVPDTGSGDDPNNPDNPDNPDDPDNPNPPVPGMIKLRFMNEETGEVYDSRWVEPGSEIAAPAKPKKKGYKFVQWSPADFSSLTKDTDIYAVFVKKTTNNTNTNPGTSNPGDSNNPGEGGNGGTTTAQTYTLTVINGSGSGSYTAGTLAVISAKDPEAGQEFSNWTIDPENTPIASKVLSATVVTMPEGNVTVTAHYKAKTTSSGGSGSAGNNASNKPGTSSGVVSNGTTVVIDKNGLSNTGVVSATVRGSSDNFTIKVSESSAAAEAVVRALQAEYGDISSIKYFPMDISLYDAKGTTKITDTTGLSISITLPLPDSLITYAGNNKVAGVVNDRLDKLTPKFTTIDGVACVTFTAEHFSPYVIYVDTEHLGASVISDNTPKTGDGIHPKWFLSLGLACISIMLFMKRDKRVLQKVRVQ